MCQRPRIFSDHPARIEGLLAVIARMDLHFEPARSCERPETPVKAAGSDDGLCALGEASVGIP
jgi:hypothetical protein